MNAATVTIRSRLAAPYQLTTDVELKCYQQEEENDNRSLHFLDLVGLGMYVYHASHTSEILFEMLQITR